MHALAHRSSHGCQSSDIQQSSSSQTVNQRQKSSCAWYSQKGAHVKSSTSYHSDTATEEQKGWNKPYVIRVKAYRIQIEKNSGVPSKSTALCSLGYHDTQHGNTLDSTKDKTRQPQHTRRFDTCLNPNPNLLVGEAVAWRRPGAPVNNLESAWLEGVWLGRDSKNR